MIREFKFADHDEWLAIRAKYIGGSDAAAVIGMNPFKSRYALWAEKTGKVEGFKGNITTKVGAYLEELVAKMFEEETGKKVQRKNATMVNDLYPFACANIDRKVVGEDAFLEIKTTNSIPIMKQVRGTDFPECYYAQVVHYMAVTGMSKAYLAVLMECRELKVFELERDQNEIDALMNAEEDFWNDYVMPCKAPDVDGTQSTTDAISQMYPNADDNTLNLTAWDKDLENYTSVTTQIKQLEEIQALSLNRIKEALGDNGKGETDFYKVSFPTLSKKTFDAKKFEADHKDIDTSAYYKESSYRRMTITRKKEK